MFLYKNYFALRLKSSSCTASAEIASYYLNIHYTCVLSPNQIVHPDKCVFFEVDKANNYCVLLKRTLRFKAETRRARENEKCSSMMLNVYDTQH